MTRPTSSSTSSNTSNSTSGSTSNSTSGSTSSSTIPSTTATISAVPTARERPDGQPGGAFSVAVRCNLRCGCGNGIPVVLIFSWQLRYADGAVLFAAEGIRVAGEAGVTHALDETVICPGCQRQLRPDPLSLIELAKTRQQLKAAGDWELDDGDDGD